MKTFKNVHTLLGGAESNFLCAIESALERIINDYKYNNLDEAIAETEYIMGESYENLNGIENGEIEDKSGYLKRLSEAYLALAEIYYDSYKEANK